MQQVYLDEWAMPTAAGVNATLIQTITPSNCTTYSSDSYLGTLTRSADGTFISFVCLNNTVGSGKGNTYFATQW